MPLSCMARLCPCEMSSSIVSRPAWPFQRDRAGSCGTLRSPGFVKSTGTRGKSARSHAHCILSFKLVCLAGGEYDGREDPGDDDDLCARTWDVPPSRADRCAVYAGVRLS